MLFAEVERTRKRGRKLLLDRDSPCILPLAEELEQAPRRALTLWALEGAERIARAEGDGRLFSCVAAARAWAEGAILMPAARRAILAVHAAAREEDARREALFHAVGQACSTVHTPRHALGLPLYELTALARRGGAYECALRDRISEYRGRLADWKSADLSAFSWAAFLKDD